jgi:small redox-active disulfide protein 2
MQIKVLGPGCDKCKKLAAEVERAIAESSVSAELEKVEKISDILDCGVMMTPALVIDGELKAQGRIPKLAEIVSWIKAAEKNG